MEETLANILETVWQNPQSYEKMKGKMKIYSRPENCSSLVVKKIQQRNLAKKLMLSKKINK